jgi:hypothetical protein
LFPFFSLKNLVFLPKENEKVFCLWQKERGVIVLLLFLPSKRDEGKQNTKKNKGEGNILEEKEEIPPPFLFFQRKK